jgi:hypothetical protein
LEKNPAQTSDLWNEYLDTEDPDELTKFEDAILSIFGMGDEDAGTD